MSWLQIIIYVLIALYILTVASVVFNVILENRTGANLGMDYRPGDRSVGRFPFLSLFRCELPEK